MKKILAAALALVMALSMVACGKTESTTSSTETTATEAESTASTNEFLYHAENTAPYVTLDPSIEYSNGIMVLQSVYETLTHYNPETGDVDPLLATEWSNSEDGLTWVFTLREDVTFHDGTDMTAAQVVSSIERTMELGQGAAYIWDAVESIEATGDYEVTFTCSYPSAIDLLSSSAYAAYIMSDSVLEQDSTWFNEGNDGGSGPYIITQATGDSVVLTAYEGYRDGWTDAQYKNILIREVAESSARRQLMETGEAQLASDFSSTDLAALKEQTDIIYTYESQTFNNVILFMNTATEPCDNADFRRALAYAFPYEEMVTDILEGSGTQSIGTVPDGLWGHNEDGFQYSMDMEKAQEYLDLSGVDTEGLTISVSYMPSYTEYSSMLQVYQANLKQLGITLELMSMEWDQQWAYAQNTNPEDRQDMFLFIWWPDYASPASWFESLAYTEEEIVFNLSYVSDESLDAIIDDAAYLTATDRDAAEALYIEAQDIIAENAYFLNLYDQTYTYIVSNSITGVSENPAYSKAIPYYEITKQ